MCSTFQSVFKLFCFWIFSVKRICLVHFECKSNCLEKHGVVYYYDDRFIISNMAKNGKTTRNNIIDIDTLFEGYRGVTRSSFVWRNVTNEKGAVRWLSTSRRRIIRFGIRDMGTLNMFFYFFFFFFFYFVSQSIVNVNRTLFWCMEAVSTRKIYIEAFGHKTQVWCVRVSVCMCVRVWVCVCVYVRMHIGRHDVFRKPTDWQIAAVGAVPSGTVASAYF
jgi:hypothetical protein